MTAAQINAKYSEFYVTRYSPKAGRHIQVGKTHATLEAALASAKRLDRDRKWMTFVDVVKPQ